MINKKTKWFIYTVLVGLIPILSRSLVWLITTTDIITFISASDFIAFGLVLHISIINEIEHLDDTSEQNWKTIQNGTSITFIAIYGVLFTLTLLSSDKIKLIDTKMINICVFILAAASFIISLSVFDRLSKSTSPIGGQK